MPFDWQRFLSLARELATRGDEASRRTAISRAYYAAFGAATLRLAAGGTTLPEADSHRFVWTEYRLSEDPVRQQIGLDGSRLRRRRVSADYHAEYARLGADPGSSLTLADDILTALEGLES